MSRPASTGWLPILVGGVLLCVLAACDDADNSGTGDKGSAVAAASLPAEPTLNVAYSPGEMRFSWNDVSGATYYRIYQHRDGAPGFTHIGEDLPATSHSHKIAVQPLNGSVALYFLEACNTAGCTASNSVNTLSHVLQAIGYFKTYNTDAHDNFEISLASSEDGNTLAVGAPGESSGATGVGGSQTSSPGAAKSGAVYIFTRDDGAWSQQAYVKASNTSAGDSFGIAVSLSSDGNTLAVGAYLEDSPGTGINGYQGDIADNSSNRGAVYVYTRSGGNWSQQAYVKASNSRDNAYFGGAVSLDSAGNTLAVGATGERTGALDAGAVYVFTRSTGAWSQAAIVKAFNIQTNAQFGSSVAINGKGNTLAVGAQGESSAATGINGDQYQDPAGPNNNGAVYVFTRGMNAWSQQAYVKAPYPAASAAFGFVVALSSDGDTLAVGAGAAASATTGISAGNVGAVHVFIRDSNVWSQRANVRASNNGNNRYFGGTAIALSGNGNMLAVGALGEDSVATNVGGNQTESASDYSGAVYIFVRSVGAWSQQAHVKAANSGPGDSFGRSLALSSDGDTLVVGTLAEASDAIDIGPNQTDNNAIGAGAAYLY